MQKLLMLFAIAAFSTGCVDESASSLTGTWKLVKYTDPNTGVVETEPNDLSRSVVVTFSDDGSAGKISGHTIKNSIYGGYEITAIKRLNVLELGGTRIAEPEWGNKFGRAITSASSFTRQGKQLFIFYKQDSAYLEFIAQ